MRVPTALLSPGPALGRFNCRTNPKTWACARSSGQVMLPDDRVIIVSGFLDDPGRPTGKPAPSIDVFDYKSRQ